MKTKCSIHPVLSICCFARSFLPALSIKPSLLKVAVEHFGIWTTDCGTQVQQGNHLFMGFPAFHVAETTLGMRVVAYPPPCTFWRKLGSAGVRETSQSDHSGDSWQSHSQHSSALEWCRLNYTLVYFGKKKTN